MKMKTKMTIRLLIYYEDGYPNQRYIERCFFDFQK